MTWNSDGHLIAGLGLSEKDGVERTRLEVTTWVSDRQYIDYHSTRRVRLVLAPLTADGDHYQSMKFEITGSPDMLRSVLMRSLDLLDRCLVQVGDSPEYTAIEDRPTPLPRPVPAEVV
jgi:hypothetical protein